MAAPLYLVRHGESEWNARRLTQGQTAHPRLTPRGREQAAASADLIAADLFGLRCALDVVRTSDLVRAVETATIIQEQVGGTLVVDRRLREQHLGSLEGKGYEETWAVAAELDWSDPELPIAGGESVARVRDRMAAVLAATDRDRATVLVTHGDAMRLAIAHLTHLAGREPQQAAWVAVPNGAVARVADGGVRWLGGAGRDGGSDGIC